MAVKIKRLKRLRSKKDLAHKVSLHGKGRWHSRTTLWKSRQKNRRKRIAVREARRRNRANQ